MKKIFERNVNYNRSAFLNWRFNKGDPIGNMLALADGFLESAIYLGGLCLLDNNDKKADMLIFPMLTNANHGIELYLKSLNWTLNELLQNGQRREGGHNIKQIYEMIVPKISTHKGPPELRKFQQDTENLKEYLDELFGLIDGHKMDFSRYPLSNDYVSHFYVERLDNVEVDLENFVVRFQNIRDTLDAICSYYFYNELLQEV